VQVPYNGEDGSGDMIRAAWKSCGVVVKAGVGTVTVALPPAVAVTVIPDNAIITRVGDPASAAPINKPTKGIINVKLFFADGTTKDMTADDRAVFTLVGKAPAGISCVSRCDKTAQ
jgi:hypothetical protein